MLTWENNKFVGAAAIQEKLNVRVAFVRVPAHPGLAACWSRPAVTAFCATLV